MKLLLLLIAINIAGITSTDVECNVVTIDGKNYDRQILLDNIHQPYQLTLDPKTNTLFFTYSAVVDSKTVQKVGYINVATKEFVDIPGVNGPVATGVDTTKNIVYFGGKDGIYTFDYATKKAKNLGVTNYSIWQMFYCPIHGLFFTTSDTEKPYVYKDGEVEPFTDLSDTKTRVIAVGEHHSVFFANSSGTFLFDHHKGKVTDLGDYNVNGFTRDSTGKLYFSSPPGFYAVNEKDWKMNKLVPVTGDETIWGGAFDKDDNILYSYENSIIKLVPTNRVC